MRIEFAERSLPTLMECEILVVGGSFAGLGAALALAQAGRSVALIEPRTYLGREITATLRPWVPQANASRDELIEGLIQAAGVPTHATDTEIPLHMEKIKLYLEDQVLAGGIQLLYASLPVGWWRGGNQRGLIIGNKSGRQLIVCQTVIDATETAIAARVTGAEFEPESAGATRWRRTLEFDQVQPLEMTSLPIPEALQVRGNVVNLHRGWTEDDVLVESEYELASTGNGLIGLNEREVTARRRSMALASHLIQNVPAFARARFGIASNDLQGAYSTSLAGAAPTWAADYGAVALSTSVASSGPVSTAMFAAPEPGVWVLGQAARLERTVAGLFEEPTTACRLGRALGEAILQGRVQAPPLDATATQAASPAATGTTSLLEVHELEKSTARQTFQTAVGAGAASSFAFPSRCCCCRRWFQRRDSDDRSGGRRGQNRAGRTQSRVGRHRHLWRRQQLLVWPAYSLHRAQQGPGGPDTEIA